MLIRRAPDIRSWDITDKKVYLNRREFIRAAGTVAAATGVGLFTYEAFLRAARPAPHGRKLEAVTKSGFSTDEIRCRQGRALDECAHPQNRALDRGR